MPGKMGNVSSEIEILRNKQKEMLDIKNNEIEIKNAYDGLLSRLENAVVTANTFFQQQKRQLYTRTSMDGKYRNRLIIFFAA